MSRPSELLQQAVRAGGAGIWTLLLWTLWLALTLTLAAQVYIAASNELTVPDFVLRRLEARLAESGLRATFKNTRFDPTGRVFVEDARISLPAYAEPIVTARGVFVQLDLWSLAVGRFEPRQIRLYGATAAVPAMLSTSGRAEEIVHNLDAAITARPHQIDILALSARIADVAVSAHGEVPLPRRAARARPGLAEFLTQEFPRICRQVISATEKIAELEEPSLELVFAPSESGSAMINVTVHARAFKLQEPIRAEAGNVAITTRVLLLGEAPEISRLELSTDELHLPFETTARGVHAVAYGRLTPGSWSFDTRELDLTAAALESAGYTATALSAQLFPRPLPRADAFVQANVLGAPLAVRADANFETRSANLRFEGMVSPAILDRLSERFRVNIRQFFDFASLQVANGVATLGPKWTFEKLTARVALQRINASGVILDDGHAEVELDPRRFHSPDAYGRIGPNFARGSYDHDLQTHAYRFVLQGRLRPLDIGGWFHEWWPNFFRQFEFPSAPPSASVDVRSFWHDGRQASVFVFADAAHPIIRGAAFDRARTRLFVRTGWVDTPELFVSQGNGVAHGAFTVASDPESGEWRTLDLALDSSLDLGVFEKIIGPEAHETLEPFKLSAAPLLKLSGHFDGPGLPEPRHRNFRLEAQTKGEFRFHNFPLQDVAFVAAVRDADITLENVTAHFAGGSATGHAKVWSEGNQRRLGFDYAIKDANLGAAIGTLQEFTSQSQPRDPAAAQPGKFIHEKASVRLDLAASADGNYADPLSFHGGGNASLSGAEIGEVPLLGSLSELLKFTALRFTSASGNFKINGPKLEFSEIALRGANSAIDAHGTYALDRHALDFNAKIYPFQESGNILKSVVGAVLTPLSNVFEVKLSGSLDKPHWAFVIGPTNFIRSLAEPGAKPDASPAATTGGEPAGAPEIKLPLTAPPQTSGPKS